MNISIRKAIADDLQSVISLSDELTQADLPYDKDVDVNWSNTEKGMKYFKQKIAGKSGVCFVAEYDGSIVGYLTASVKDVPSYRLVTVVDLENIVVSGELRSKGVGKILMNAFLGWAREQKAHKVSVSVYSANKKGIAFYVREGFIPYDTTLEMPIPESS